MIVFVALLMVFGVMFGTGTLAIDLGYSMAEQTLMQNAADAGALAAAKKMASAVSNGNSGPVFLVADADVHKEAQSLAGINTADALGRSYETVVEYLDCDGYPAASQTFTAGSFTPSGKSGPSFPAPPGSLAADVYAAAVEQASGHTPPYTLSKPPYTQSATVGSASTICQVRVYVRATSPALFASIPPLGLKTEAATASATARIAPTAPPTEITNTWPVTHYLPDGGPTDCPYGGSKGPCQFWDSGSGSLINGSFKETIDLSKLAYPSDANVQLFNCDSATCWDQDHPGTHQLSDVQYWLANLWHGHIKALPDPSDPTKPDPNCLNVSPGFPQCQNSRLQVDSLYDAGDHGQNLAGQVQSYINSPFHSEGTDPTCSCKFVTLPIYLWQYGETYDSTTKTWSPWTIKNKAKYPDRIIVLEVRNFRFVAKQANASSVEGYYVSFYNPNGIPGNGPPNNVANTVVLVG
jgi:hypothetical protein